MVSSKDLRAANALINDSTGPRVAVFVGGTSGIGQLTVHALVATGASVRVYLVGRPSSAERTHAFIDELHTLNPRAQVIWTEGEIALLAETSRVCDVIRAKESRIDLLFLSAGYAPFGPRQETAEGIEVAQSLEYYSRVLFILRLLPGLESAEAPRVISVGGGGLERKSINLDDLDLKKPGNFGAMKAQPQYLMMNTAGLARLADDHPHVTFIHSWPGLVSTGNVRRSADPNSLMGWFIWLVMEPLIRLFSSHYDEAAQRHLFQCTSAVFGGRGTPWTGAPGINSRSEAANGLFLVNFRCDCTPNPKVMPWMREHAVGPVWNHTQEVLRPYL